MQQQLFIYFKRLTIFTAFALFLIGASSGFAQTNDPSIPPGLRSPLDKFLIADAEPPLRLSDVERAAAMLASVTESSLNHEQKDEFQQTVETEWRAGNQETIRFINDWNAFADKLASLKKYAEQVALKERTLPISVADLKKYPNDAKRRIIRQAYRRAHGANVLGAFRVEPRVLKTGGTLKDVFGDWMIETGAGANMRFLKFSFLADGRAAFGETSSAQNKNCYVTDSLIKEGTVEVAGGELTVRFPTVKSQRIDSCQPAAIKSETFPAETVRYNWQIKSDENEMLLLCLTEANGKTNCYRKTN